MKLRALPKVTKYLGLLTLAMGLLTAGSQAQNSIVFVSSADWDLTTGIAAADALCNDLAEASGLDTTNGFYLAARGESR